MQEFYFDIKARENTEGDSFSKWGWPPVWSGRVEAENSKDARAKIETEYNQKFILKDGKNTQDNMFLLSLKPMNDYLAKRFEIVNCLVCGSAYSMNDAYLLGLRNAHFCSIKCQKENESTVELQRLNESINSFELSYANPPVIYLIKNIIENKCYIGKSVRSFTLRWWEHIKIAKSYSNATNKFHSALQNSKLVDWEFKVIEVISYPEHIKTHAEMNKYILERETFWMNNFDSINSGYNTLESLKTVVEKIQTNLIF